MGAWAESLLGSDAAQEAVDCFIVNVQALKRPLTDRVTLKKVLDETLTELHVGNVPLANAVADGSLSVAVLAIAEHLRLHGVTIYPIREYVDVALSAELKDAKTWINPRKRRGVLQSFAMKVGL